MRWTVSVAFCYSLFAAAACAQTGVAAGSEPSPMEAFANQRGVRIAWSNEVTRVEHDGTSLVLTALVLEGSGPLARAIRGVKVSLSSGSGQDRIYLDEEAAARTRSALE